MATTELRTPPLGERARTAPSPWASSYRYSPDDLSPTKYAEMLRLGGHCRQALRFTKNQVLSLLGDYKHADERVQDGIAYATEALQGTWRGVLSNILDAIWYGFSVSERVWDNAPANPYGLAWYYSRVKPTPPQSWYPRGLVTDEFGNLKQLIQWRQSANSVELELNRAVHWAYEGRGSVWGAPAARLAHKWWQTRRDVHDMWLLGIERLSSPVIVDVVPQGTVRDRATNQERSFADFAAEGWRSVTSGGVLVREAFAQELGATNYVLLPQFEVIRGDGWQQEFADYCDYAAREIYVALGLPPLLMMEPQHASRAHTESIALLTQIMLMPVAEEFAEDVIIDQLVKPLIVANYGEQDDYGEVPVQLPIDENEVAGVVRDLWQAGFTWATSEAHYRRIQARLPSLLPEWEEFAGEAAALPTVRGEAEQEEGAAAEELVPEEAREA